MLEHQESPDTIASSLLTLTILMVLLAYILLGNELVRDLFGFGDRGNTGDFIAGVAAPFIGFLSAALIYLSFRQQVKANRIQIMALNEEIKVRKDEAKLARYKNIVNQLRGEILSLVYQSRIERTREYTGMQAYEVFTSQMGRNSAAPLIDNINVLDAIFGITILIKKTIWEVDDENEDLRQEVLDDLYVFYSLKVGKGLNTLSSVKGNQTIDYIRQNKVEIEALFEKHGFSSSQGT